MLPRILGFLVLALVLGLLSARAGEDKFARQKDKDGLVEPKKDEPKAGNVPDKAKMDKGKDAKGVTGKVKSINLVKGSFNLAAESDREQTFLVTDGTKFLGPRGGNRGTGRTGLKDDGMSVGSTVRVVPAADGKNAGEVYLAPVVRKKK